MSIVGIVALTAVFWFDVATLHLMIQGGGCAARCQPSSPAPSRSESTRPQLQKLQIELIPVKPGTLTRADVAADMEALQQEMTDCKDLGWKGVAMVDVVIGPRGWVRSADVPPKIAETQAGRCVEAHVYARRFPPSEAGLTTRQAFRLY